MEFLLFSPYGIIWYNVKFYTVLTPKMKWESLNCKIYLRLRENVLEISLKMFTREYEHFRPEVQATLILVKPLHIM